MTVAGKQLCAKVERAIKKLIAKNASWSRILAKDLHRTLVAYQKEGDRDE